MQVEVKKSAAQDQRSLGLALGEACSGREYVGRRCALYGADRVVDFEEVLVDHEANLTEHSLTIGE